MVFEEEETGRIVETQNVQMEALLSSELCWR